MFGVSRKINGSHIKLPIRVLRYFPTTYDVAKWEFIKEHCKGISLDLGAHIGLFTVEMAQLSDWVIAVEPTVDSFHFLSETIRLNRLPNVTLINMCATNIDGWVDFYTTKNIASCLNSNSPLPEGNRVRKLSFTIDSLGLPIDFMKVDIEGGELKALIGAKKTLQFTKAISLELHPRQLRSNSGSTQDLHRLLSDYSPKYYKDGRNISSQEFANNSVQGEFQILLGR